MKLRKSMVLFLFGLVFLSSLVFADQDGDYTYTVSGGNATITGYTGAGGDISIPATLGGYPTVAIGDSAFESQDTLTSVIIPNSVNSIGNEAFNHCTGLTSLTIPDSVTTIGNFAFYYCTGMTSITVDASNPNYSSLDGVLYNKAGTTLVVCPAGKAGAFIIQSGVISINSYAFSVCTGLTSVTIPDSVTSIGTNAFTYCKGMTSITVDASNTNYSSLDGVLYNYTKTTLIQCPAGKSGALIIPSSVTSIGDDACAYCAGLTSVTIPDSVTSIGYQGFAYCYGLTSVSIPGSVTSIGNDSFNSCKGLTSITIMGSVTNIGNFAFYYCTEMISAFFYGEAPTMGIGVFDNCASGFTVYYLAGSTGFTNPWYGYPTAVFDPSGTTTTTSPTTTSTVQSSTTSVSTTTTAINTTTTSAVSSTTTTIEAECALTVEKGFLPLRAGLFARLRRIVIKGTNSEWDKTSQVTIDDINTIIRRVKDQETIIAWVIIPGKQIAKFEPGTKAVIVQTPWKEDCTGEITIE